MPGSNAISLANFQEGYLPRVNPTQAKGFDKVAVGNGVIPRPLQPPLIGVAPSQLFHAHAGSPPAYETPLPGGNSPIKHGRVDHPSLFGGDSYRDGGAGGDFLLPENPDVLTYPPKITPEGEPWASSNEPAASFPLHRAPSLESLFAPGEFGEMQQPSDLGDGLGMYGGGAGGDGPQRADFLPQFDRGHPLDLGRQSPTYQLQHHKDVARELSPVTQQWDQQAGATTRHRAATGETPPDALFNEAQTQASNMSREQAARSVLSDLGVPRSEVDALLTRHANSAGGVEVLNACRLLSMPEVKADTKVRAALEKQLDRYLDADKGRYTGLYRAFGKNASKPLKELKESIEKTFEVIGRSVIENRLLTDSTAAVVGSLARKNPDLSSEALRRQLPDLINAQAFSAYRQRLEGADARGVLQDTKLLPQLAQAAERPQPAPANKAADPVNDFAKHLVSVLGAIKLPDIHVENNARNIVNQDGWNFQGNKDPRPAPAVEAAVEPIPLLIDELPEVDDAESQVLDAIVDATASELDIEEDTNELDDEQDPPEVLHTVRDDHQRHQLTHSTGRNAAPVHPLHGNLMKDLMANSRFDLVANGGVHPNLEHLIAVRSDRVDEEEEETGAGNGHTRNTDKPDRFSPFQRLASPFPLGQRAHDVRGRTRE
ncbi:hypothetical protein [Stenotrophomonas chelatiphaga]|uniref:hypothetical protein n=1 Tax=Stenotrophomonas chelatiphaga TaxID=517011 RepID=UPI002897C1A2|nr:hypothetical protein [Stenotrophomonas chelatiphaga]